MHRRRIVDRAAVVGVRVLAHEVRPCGVPRIRVGGDDALGGLLRLAEDEPVPPRGGEAGVAVRERVADRDGVEDGGSGDGRRVVERDPLRDIRAAVVAGHCEPRVSELAAEVHDVASHRAARVRLVVERRWAASTTRRSRAGRGRRR
jgi:hypothetical protein